MNREIHIHIKGVTIAHDSVILKSQKFDHSDGRRVCGLCIGLTGEVVYKLSTGESYTFGEGDVFFLPSGIAYTASAKTDFRHYIVNFTADMNEKNGIFKVMSISLFDNARFKALFRELIDLYNQKGIGYSMRAVGYVYSLMAEFITGLYEESITSSNGKNLLLAKEYIDKNYKEDITIEKLSQIASMSQTNFRREFKRLFYEAPMQYRDRVRLSYAKEFLSSGFYNVGEAASLLGIDDEGYFCRFFKKHTGLTPKEYAKRKI